MHTDVPGIRWAALGAHSNTFRILTIEDTKTKLPNWRAWPTLSHRKPASNNPKHDVDEASRTCSSLNRNAWASRNWMLARPVPMPSPTLGHALAAHVGKQPLFYSTQARTTCARSGITYFAVPALGRAESCKDALKEHERDKDTPQAAKPQYKSRWEHQELHPSGARTMTANVAKNRTSKQQWSLRVLRQ